MVEKNDSSDSLKHILDNGQDNDHIKNENSIPNPSQEWFFISLENSESESVN